MVTRRSTWLNLILLVACQGNRDAPPPPREDAAPAPPADASGSGANAQPDAKSDEPEPPTDSNKVIAELDAIPAWQAVIDRAQLLARRDQHGVVYGRIGGTVMVPAPPPPPVPATGSGSAKPVPAPTTPPKVELVASPYVWLIDDTEGSGALAIRVQLSKPAKQGDRVAIGGAWHLDDARRWYWKGDSLQAVPPPKEPSKDPVVDPGHAITNGNLLPGSHTITVAKENEAVYFTVVGAPPANDGDGWPVANELGDPVYALLILPGERASYGGQDMRAADERWSLKRGQTYTLRIGRIRTRGPDKPAVIYAKSAPIRVL